MLPKSIRWRLPLSYALMALLTALALGTILLLILQSYYQQREIRYLQNYAQALTGEIRFLLATEESQAALQAYFSGLALFSDVRVQLLDSQGQIMADTGPAHTVGDARTLSIEMDVENEFGFIQEGIETIESQQFVTASHQAQLTAPENISASQRIMIIEGYADPDTQTYAQTSEIIRDLNLSDVNIISGQGVTTVKRFVIETDSLSDFSASELSEMQAYTPRLPLEASSLWLAPFASETETFGGGRSKQRVEIDLITLNGETLGRLHIFDGPAYGEQILQSVALGWGISSFIALILAAIVGWFISRRMSNPLLDLSHITTQMAQGNLSIRANIAHEDEFGSLANSFNDMAQQVETTVTTLRRFAADAAHELYTPLTALKTNLEMVSTEENPQQQQTFIQQAQAQLQRLETLSSGLFDLAKFENQHSQNQYQSFCLNDLVSEICEVYASQAEQKQLSFDLALPSEKINIQGDRAQLVRALANILDNALKFTPSDGQIKVALKADDKNAKLSIQDTGIGIPADDLAHLFNRFHRGRNTAAYSGNGLGLAIVKAIIQNHNGHIEINPLAVGTMMHIDLPLENKKQRGNA